MKCQTVNYLIDVAETDQLNADQKQAVDQHLQKLCVIQGGRDQSGSS